MAWTTPKTWTAETLAATDMNTHIRDNLNALKTPPTEVYNGNEGTDLTLSSASWADLDATSGKFSLDITTTGGDVMFGFSANFNPVGGNSVLYLDIMIDGVAWANTTFGATSGVFAVPLSNTANAIDGGVNLVRLLQDIPAGTHTFKMRYKVLGSNITLFRAAGTADADIMPQFWVREIS